MLSRDIYRVTLFLLTAYVTAFGDCVSWMISAVLGELSDGRASSATSTLLPFMCACVWALLSFCLPPRDDAV
jgi:hypothetical protein